MEKDNTIIYIVNKIQAIFEPGAIQIVDSWEGDLCAIGIKKNHKLIYISTYNYINNSSTNYDFDLEIITDDNSYKVVKEVKNAPEQELLKTITDFSFSLQSLHSRLVADTVSSWLQRRRSLCIC